MLFFLAQGFFEREGVRFIDFVGNVFPDPGTALVQFERRIFLRHLFDADQNLQQSPRDRYWRETEQYSRAGRMGGVELSRRSRCNSKVVLRDRAAGAGDFLCRAASLREG